MRQGRDPPDSETRKQGHIGNVFFPVDKGLLTRTACPSVRKP